MLQSLAHSSAPLLDFHHPVCRHTLITCELSGNVAQADEAPCKICTAAAIAHTDFCQETSKALRESHFQSPKHLSTGTPCASCVIIWEELLCS